MANSCISACQYNYQRCIGICNADSTCAFECNSDFIDCENGCPCFQDCPQGCEHCNNGFCKCQDRYRNPDYIECEGKVKNYLPLLLSFTFFPGAQKSFELEYSKCIVTCAPADFACYGFCSREFEENTQKCPCGASCPTGCPCYDYRSGFRSRTI